MPLKTTLILIFIISFTHSLNILVIFPHFGKSHLLVFLPLFKQLSLRNHNLTLLSFFSDSKNLQYYKQITFTDDEIKGGEEFTFEEIKYSRWEKYGGANLLHRFATYSCEKIVKSKNVHKLLEEKHHYDLILTEYFNMNCHMGIIKKFSAPIIGLSTCINPTWINDYFGQPEHPGYIPSQFMDHSDRMTFLERVESVFIYVYSKAVYKYFISKEGNEYSKKYLNEDVLTNHDDMYNASLLLVNNHFTLNRPKPLSPNVIEIGGIHVHEAKKLPEYLQTFLDGSPEGVIYMSMGTMLTGASFPADKQKNFIKIFSRLRQKIIWKWEYDMMENKPDNVMIAKWLPQQDILCHPNVKAFVGHGGLLGIIEAVHCGVPMMLMPQFGDQHVNSKAVEVSGGGIVLQLNEATEDNIEKNLKKLLSKEFQQSSKDLSVRFKDRPLSPMDTAIYWIEYVARHKGAKFLRTAATDMPWYQYIFLDVILFLTVTITIFLYVIYKVLKYLFRFKIKEKIN